MSTVLNVTSNGKNVLETRKYEVIGTDPRDNIWTVATDDQRTANVIAATFRKEGYTDVHIIER